MDCINFVVCAKYNSEHCVQYMMNFFLTFLTKLRGRKGPITVKLRIPI